MYKLVNIAKTFSQLDIYGMNIKYFCPQKLINHKFQYRGMNTTGYNLAKNTDKRNYIKINEYVKKDSESNKCHNSVAQKDIYENNWHSNALWPLCKPSESNKLKPACNLTTY